MAEWCSSHCRSPGLGREENGLLVFSVEMTALSLERLVDSLGRGVRPSLGLMLLAERKALRPMCSRLSL